MKRTVLLVVGFISMLTGMMAFFMSFIGINFVFLEWLDGFGEGLGFVLKAVLALFGFIAITIAQLNVKEENQEPEIM